MKTPVILAVSLLAVVSGYAAAQADDNYQVFRTEYGHPDLQGVWNFSSDTPFERPEVFGEREFLTPEEARDGTLFQAVLRESMQRMASMQAHREAALAAQEVPNAGLDSGDPLGAVEGEPEGSDGGFYGNFIDQSAASDNLRTSLITYPTNGRLPAIVDGAVHQIGGLGGDIPSQRPVRFMVGGISMDGPEDRGLSERCIVGFNAGPPFSPSGYNNNLQIIQHKDHVVILMEQIHDARFIPLDSSAPPLHDNIRLWSGDSRAYWDGDTLVVESKNFTDLIQPLGTLGTTQTLYAQSDYGTAYHKSVTERFTRVGPNTINYEYTLEDPATFTDRIEASFPITKIDELIYEYACHEGNYAMGNALRGGRMQERQAAAANKQ